MTKVKLKLEDQYHTKYIVEKKKHLTTKLEFITRELNSLEELLNTHLEALKESYGCPVETASIDLDTGHISWDE